MAKIITFFNEKGGTGKTTMTALFASWLAYKKLESVIVYDMDFPMYQLSMIREGEMKIIETRPESDLAKMVRRQDAVPFGLGKAAAKEAFSQAELDIIAKSITAQSKKAEDAYILIDFPGRYLNNDPVYYLSKKGIIDLVVFPIDSDLQSRSSALKTYHSMNTVCEKKGGQKCLMLWNKETANERRGSRDWYEKPNQIFSVLGIPVAGRRVRDIVIARRESSTFGFIRSTLCWPESNIRKACPYLPSIFEEIKCRVDGTWNDTKKSEIYG